jgi:hypothetical protein
MDKTLSTATGASYELFFTRIAKVPKLEIKTKSYWDSSVPASYFSSTQTNSSGVSEETFDFVQINIDYPQAKDLTTMKVDPRNDAAKVFITFQYTADGANTPITNFYEPDPYDYDAVLVVKPGTGWETQKFQVMNGSIIYLPELPSGISFKDISICVHVEFSATHSLTKQLESRFIKFSAKNLSNNSSSANSAMLSQRVNSTPTGFKVLSTICACAGAY